MLREAIRGTGKEATLFELARMKIKPCQNCGGCKETGRCIIKDDMESIAAAIRSADRIILASPVFFSGVSAQTKAMIDRCQQFWCEKYLLKRPLPGGVYGRKGLFIAVGGQTGATGDAGIKCSEETAKAFFRSISVNKHGSLAFAGIDAKGEIKNHPTAMKEAFEAGRELVK